MSGMGMLGEDPLLARHGRAGAEFVRYGSGAEGAGVDVVATFGEIEAEYAAIRKGCALVDQPQRGTVEVRGKDRLEFLNRMLTGEVGPKGLSAWRSARAFWLNRKGRIDADVRVIELPDRALLDVDALSAETLVRTLREFVFTEDVTIEDVRGAWRSVAVHGPGAAGVIAAATGLERGAACAAVIGGVEVIVDRQDSTGEVGLEVRAPMAEAARVWDALEQNGARPAGWHAYNVARIEAGWALFNIDFGPESLPHETGVLKDRVSFTKGCYLGQEVVARMQSLGHPKQMLVGLRVDEAPAEAQGPAAPIEPERKMVTANALRQPSAGAAVLAAPPGGEDAVGAVTSSALSPMLGDAPVCFAQVRFKHAALGTRVRVETAAGVIGATVRESLVFWSRG